MSKPRIPNFERMEIGPNGGPVSRHPVSDDTLRERERIEHVIRSRTVREAVDIIAGMVTEAREKALDEAAQAADEIPVGDGDIQSSREADVWHRGSNITRQAIIGEIRALKEKP